MNKFRASHTVLSLWASGRYDDAIDAYFKIPGFVTPQMEAGKAYHEKWEAHIKKNKTFHDELGGDKLKEPKSELKIVQEVYDWLDLVGVIDCLDGDQIYEFKTGVKSSSSFGSTFQVGVYGLLCKLKGIPVSSCVVIHYNQYTKKTDRSIFWITPRMLDDALNWVETYAGEMKEYIEKNDIEKTISDRK